MKLNTINILTFCILSRRISAMQVRPFLDFDPPTLLPPKLYFDLFVRTLLPPKLFDLCGIGYALRPIGNPDLEKLKYRVRSKEFGVRESKYRVPR